MSDLKTRALAILAATSFAFALMNAYQMGRDSGKALGDTACAARHAELRALIDEQLRKAGK